jgi:hypothetical protein
MATVRKSNRLKKKDVAVTYADPASDDEGMALAAAGSGSSGRTTAMVAANPSSTPYEAASEDDFDKVPDGPKRKRKAKASGKGAGASKAGDDQRPTKRHRGKRGLLERMTELPMDLLFEVGPISLCNEVILTASLDFWETRPPRRPELVQDNQSAPRYPAQPNLDCNLEGVSGKHRATSMS